MIFIGKQVEIISEVVSTVIKLKTEIFFKQINSKIEGKINEVIKSLDINIEDFDLDEINSLIYQSHSLRFCT